MYQCDENELPFDLYETSNIGCILSERHFVKLNIVFNATYCKVFFFFQFSHVAVFKIFRREDSRSRVFRTALI